MNSTLLRRIVARVVHKTPLYDLLPPYDYMQTVVEQCLHEYIAKRPEDLKKICIVGGYIGQEIWRLLRIYRQSEITVFEPSSRYIADLQKQFKGNARINVQEYAVSDTIGEVDFYETTLPGSGSLLRLGQLAIDSYAASAAEIFKVQTVTLDSALSCTDLDCLWIDVQGAELNVLRGATKTLSKTSSIFLEVSQSPDLYQGAAVQDEIEDYLKRFGFEIVLLGLDKGNLTGNALFINKSLISSRSSS